MDGRLELDPGKILVISDFDGTISDPDVMVVLLDKYSKDDWYEYVRMWERRDVNLREALRLMYDSIKASPEDIIGVIKNGIKVREGFRDFVDWCTEKGFEFRIVSEGLDFVIKETLRTVGVEAEVVTNHAVFEDPMVKVEFPERPPECDHDDGDVCGTCKLVQVQNAKKEGKLVVYIGDGTTDVRPAREADIVFARRALAKGFDAEGRSYMPFMDFRDIKVGLEAMLDNL